MKETFYKISPGKQSTISKLYHLTFLLDSPSNKLDHMSLWADCVRLSTLETIKSQLLEGITALKSAEVTVALSVINKI